MRGHSNGAIYKQFQDYWALTAKQLSLDDDTTQNSMPRCMTPTVKYSGIIIAFNILLNV